MKIFNHFDLLPSTQACAEVFNVGFIRRIRVSRLGDNFSGGVPSFDVQLAGCVCFDRGGGSNVDHGGGGDVEHGGCGDVDHGGGVDVEHGGGVGIGPGVQV